MLKVISGGEVGEEIRCSGPETVLGKSARSAVRFSGAGVSFEHAVILRGEGAFFVENLSANGTYVNEERISGKVKLRAKDRVRLSADTLVRVESVTVEGAAAGGMGKTKMLLGVVALMMVALVVVLVVDPFGGTSGADYGVAYGRLLPWVDGAAEQGRLPVEAGVSLRRAWRLEQAGDKVEAGKEWVRLRVVLDMASDRGGLPTPGPNEGGALKRLMDAEAKGAARDEVMGAGLVEFVAAKARGR